MLVYRGEAPSDLNFDLPTLRGSFRFPIKYGYACVGRVGETGRDVSTPALDDLVFAHHPHQTEFVVPASMLIRLPLGLPPDAAVLLANIETAINVLLDAHPHFGEHVTIFGQGVVGLLLAQLMKKAGCRPVITVDPVESRRKVSMEVGADFALEPGRDLPGQIASLTDGRGADYVIEASGNPSALDLALECVALEGTVVVASWYGTKEVRAPLGGRFHRGRLRIVSSQVGSMDPCLGARWSRARRAALAIAMLSELRLRQLITHRIPFDQAAHAYDLVDRRPEETIQVVLTYGEGHV
jgi:2-desacetyl-2-hydroxyethyl bacteriochlorophyllide A dehydrogenase